MVAAVVVLSGCAPWVDSDQVSTDTGPEITLQTGVPIGQTFVTHHSGLNGIEVWLTPVRAGQGSLRLHLAADPTDRGIITSATLPAADIGGPGFYRFSFPPLRDSHSHYYYAVLEVDGDTEMRVGAGSGNRYLDGALHVNDAPVDAQMGFRLTYDRGHMLLDLARFAVWGAGLLLVTGLLYVVPGWALLVLLRKHRASVTIGHWAEGLGVAVGLSLTIFPVFMLWLNVVRIRAGPLIAYLPILGGLAVLVWHYRPWRWRKAIVKTTIVNWLGGPTAWPDVILAAVLLVVSAGRLLAVRSLEMPLWDDSVQHAVIVQRMLESGGLFTSWNPYAPYHTFSQQFGFHADVAVWAWLTGMDAPAATIWAGQIMIILAGLTLYPLAYRIRGAWAGSVTVFVASILLLFPAYYINWGRYPQMAGQIVMPIAAWWVWALWNSEEKWHSGDIVLGACLIVGTILCYYRMAFHLVAFVLTTWLLAPSPLRRFIARKKWLALAAVALGAGILLFPWLSNLASPQGAASEATVGIVSPGSPGLWARMQTVGVSWLAPKALVLLIGTLVAVWGGVAAALPTVWIWLLKLLPILRLTSLPAVSIIQEFTIDTSLYIPQALIWGILIALCVDRLHALYSRRSLIPATAAMLIVAVSFWRLPALTRITDRGYDLSTRPDLRAATWINNSLPKDAFFLINGFLYGEGTSSLGADGGWWLPLLTQRGVVTPPQYALLTEQPDRPGYSEAANELIRQLTAIPATTPEGHAAICRFPHPITHVYLGQRQGLVNKALPKPPEKSMLSSELLLRDPVFRLIYRSDRVMIFEFDRSICS